MTVQIDIAPGSPTYDDPPADLLDQIAAVNGILNEIYRMTTDPRIASLCVKAFRTLSVEPKPKEK